MTNTQEKTFIIFELPHQDMLIKWLCSQIDIEHYQTERELKMDNGNLNAYPNLIVYKIDDNEIYVEFERTRKTPERFRKNLMVYANTIKTTTKFTELSQHRHSPIELKIKSIISGVYPSQHTYEIWNNKKI